METIAALIFGALILLGAICALFLVFVQPIWGLVDVAVSKEHSGATKAVVIVLTLLLLGPVVTFCYACFGTRSDALRRATLSTFAGLMLAGLSAVGIGIAVPAIQTRWKPAPQMVTAAGERHAAAPAKSERFPADEVVPFTALHLVPAGNSGWSVSIAEFTGYGPRASSTIPLVLPSIYPITHLAVDTNGPAYYAITTHQVGRIVPATGNFIALEPDPAVGQPSWPSALAFDSKEGRLLVAARSYGYSYHPLTGEWKKVPGLKDNDLAALVYAPDNDLVYGLRTQPGGGQAIRLLEMSRNGALLRETDLSEPIPVGRYPLTLAQLCRSGEQLIVLVSSPDRGGAAPPSPTPPTMYSVDPSSGRCRLVDGTAVAEAAQMLETP